MFSVGVQFIEPETTGVINVAPTNLYAHLFNASYIYKLGYRNFIFFVNSTNIIEKTKDNFLNLLSEKYLFAPKIKFGEKQVDIKEVQNFQATNPANINIIFSTIQGLHTRLNYPKENVLTEEDFEGKDIVLISDEAHHIQTLTRNKLTKTLEEERKTWEYTIIKRIFGKNPKNILLYGISKFPLTLYPLPEGRGRGEGANLLEFTATIDLSTQEIVKKYEDKIIYQYDLKQFRLDKYSKEIEVLQEDFSEEKCMLLDSENVDEEKQLKLNSLESKNNETRAIFAVNMLNEGWDVLNLLYGISKFPLIYVSSPPRGEDGR